MVVDTVEEGTIGRRRGKRTWRLSENQVKGWEEEVGTEEVEEEVEGEEAMEVKVRVRMEEEGNV